MKKIIIAIVIAIVCLVAIVLGVLIFGVEIGDIKIEPIIHISIGSNEKKEEKNENLENEVESIKKETKKTPNNTNNTKNNVSVNTTNSKDNEKRKPQYIANAVSNCSIVSQDAQKAEMRYQMKCDICGNKWGGPIYANLDRGTSRITNVFHCKTCNKSRTVEISITKID